MCVIELTWRSGTNGVVTKGKLKLIQAHTLEPRSGQNGVGPLLLVLSLTMRKIAKSPFDIVESFTIPPTETKHEESLEESELRSRPNPTTEKCTQIIIQ